MYLRCLVGSSNPQTVGGALLLLSAVARVVPDRAVKHAMSVFTLMGTSLLRNDSNFTFGVIEKVRALFPCCVSVLLIICFMILLQTIEAIVPAAARSADGAVSVLRVFADNFANVPTHRRMRLFALLSSTVGVTTALPALIVLLLHNKQVACRLDPCLCLADPF